MSNQVHFLTMHSDKKDRQKCVNYWYLCT